MTTTTSLFEITQGSFSYDHTTILANLEFSLKKGIFYGLIGPNGSGKSTLIDLLMGTRKFSTGTITLNSKPINRYSRHELALHLALVPQDISIGFEYSVYDIVLMGRHPHIPRFSRPSTTDLTIVDHALQLLDVAHLKDRLITRLSGGEKQRVIVARALAQQTDVLMLDEATSNLDIEHTIQIMRVLKERVHNSENTIIAAIHDLNLAAAFCDELLVLHNQTLHTIGPVNSVLTVDLLKTVFSVNGKILQGATHPRIEYEMHSTNATTI